SLQVLTSPAVAGTSFGQPLKPTSAQVPGAGVQVGAAPDLLPQLEPSASRTATPNRETSKDILLLFIPIPSGNTNDGRRARERRTSAAFQRGHYTLNLPIAKSDALAGGAPAAVAL